jgi:polyferredoxin
VLLLLYILLALLIAGANFGWAPNADPRTRQAIRTVWELYENPFKTLLILVCSLLTLSVVGKKEVPRMRRYNLLGFLCAAVVVHIIGPLITRNADLYFVAMPLPWSTAGLRLALPASSLYEQQIALHGAWSIRATLVGFIAVHGVVLAGTLLLGRRWQCSTLCLFNGFAAEVFEPAFPLLGKKKKAGGKLLHLFSVMRWLMLAAALLLTILWVLPLVFDTQLSALPLAERVETYKYLAGELILAMFLWCVFAGRGYCYYCPLGTVLGWAGRLVDQKIVTNRSRCIDCGRCDRICPMSISIREKAQKEQPVVDRRCVGCGHCVDACPVHTLGYSTRFLSRIGRI